MKNKLTITINGKSFTGVELEGNKLKLELEIGGSIEFTNLETGDRVEFKLEPIER